MRGLATAAGLALLYASAYYLPFLTPYALYFVPSFFDYIVLPSLVSFAVLTPIFYFLGRAPDGARWRRPLIFCGATALLIIAVKGVFEAAGYPWMNLLKVIPLDFRGLGPGYLRWGRIALVGTTLVAALLFVYVNRKNLSKLLRFLSTLGFTFLLLATYRYYASDFNLATAPQGAPPSAATQSTAPAARRVIWVIFDEMDYAISMGSDARTADRLPNFARLATKSISASNARAPGRDTLYSIPSLLMGKPISGVRLTPQSQVHMRDSVSATVAFRTKNSVFEKIPGGPASASVLGFYHPYCKVFPNLQSCHSTYLGNAGRWFDSLAFFSEAFFSALRHVKWVVQYMPEGLLYQFDPMYRVSIDTLSRLDRTISNRSSALDFIHLNLPHLPNVYVQRFLQQPAGNDEDAYAQNLVGADMVLGRIVAQLETQARHQNLLLIVSSDHWLRPRSSSPASVPFMAWKVGEHAGQTLAQPFSTVHSADIAADFLNQRLDSQTDVSNFMTQSAYHKTWIAPDDYKY